MRRISRWALLFFVNIIPTALFAQGGLPDQIVTCTGVDCTICDLVQLAQNILNTGIFLAVFLSAIMFAYAGWIYMTSGASAGKSKAKDIFAKVGGGLIIILSSWLIVDTLMRTLTGADWGPWNSIC